MIRLCSCEGSKELTQKIVSMTIAHYIKRYFGEPDSNGNLTDIEEIRNFMLASRLLSELCDKTAIKGDGLLLKAVAWDEIILARYSDILAKLEDTKHEYTFDEFGERLIFALSEAHADAYDYDYNEDDYFWEYTPGGEELYEELLASIQKEAPSTLADFDDYDALLDICEKNDIDIEKFYYAYSYMYANASCDIGTYNTEEFEYDLKEMAFNEAGIDHDVSKEVLRSLLNMYMFSFYESPILWDYDYKSIIPDLTNKSATDYFLKTFSALGGTLLQNYNDIFKGKDDMYEL